MPVIENGRRAREGVRGVFGGGVEPFGGKWVRLLDADPNVPNSDPGFLPLGTGDVPRRPSAGEEVLSLLGLSCLLAFPRAVGSLHVRGGFKISDGEEV